MSNPLTSPLQIADLPTGGTRYELPPAADCSWVAALLFVQTFFVNGLAVAFLGQVFPPGLALGVPLFVGGLVLLALVAHRAAPGNRGVAEITATADRLAVTRRFALFRITRDREVATLRRLVLFHDVGYKAPELVALFAEGEPRLRLSWGEPFAVLADLGPRLAARLGELTGRTVEITTELRLRLGTCVVTIEGDQLRVDRDTRPSALVHLLPVNAVSRLVLLRSGENVQLVLVAVGASPLVLFEQAAPGEDLAVLAHELARRLNEARSVRRPAAKLEAEVTLADTFTVAPARAEQTRDGPSRPGRSAQRDEGQPSEAEEAAGVPAPPRRTLPVDLPHPVVEVMEETEGAEGEGEPRHQPAYSKVVVWRGGAAGGVTFDVPPRVSLRLFQFALIACVWVYGALLAWAGWKFGELRPAHPLLSPLMWAALAAAVAAGSGRRRMQFSVHQGALRVTRSNALGSWSRTWATGELASVTAATTQSEGPSATALVLSPRLGRPAQFTGVLDRKDWEWLAAVLRAELALAAAATERGDGRQERP